MLFHKSSRVEHSDIIKGAKIEASLGSQPDEGPDIDYHVWEEVPVSKTEQPSSPNGFSQITEYELRGDHDSRDPMLHLNMESLEVHHVTAACYSTTSHPVRRHRSTEQQPEF